jgi:hypothetical protein
MTYAQVTENRRRGAACRSEASALGGFPDLKQLARHRGHGETALREGFPPQATVNPKGEIRVSESFCVSPTLIESV